MSNITKIFLVRHGQTEWNQQNRLQGHKNSPLTKDGEVQASQIRNYLSQYEIHRGYVSPLQRAQDTIDIILKDRKIEIIKFYKLKEINLGPWEGRTKEETKILHPVEYEHFWNSQAQFSLPGAETYQHLQDRMVQGLSEIFLKEKNKNILVVSHWIAIKTALAYYAAIPLHQLCNVPDIENGKCITLICEDGSLESIQTQDELD